MKKINREKDSAKAGNGGLQGGKKKLIAAGIAAVVLICAALVFVRFIGGDTPVDFSEVAEKDMPDDTTSDIIPEYRSLERALACAIDDDVYVVVTRGEKPTSGFGVSVKKLVLEEKDGKENLIVYALFEDPQKQTAISQILTYPVRVVKTDLKSLPDTIELRIQY